jgi:hypothetical protein
VNEAKAQRGKMLTNAQADAIIVQAAHYQEKAVRRAIEEAST